MSVEPGTALGPRSTKEHESAALVERTEALLLQVHDALEAAREKMRGACEPDDRAVYDQVNAALYAVRGRSDLSALTLPPVPGVDREVVERLENFAWGGSVVTLETQANLKADLRAILALVSPLEGKGSSSGSLPAHGAPQSSAPETEAAHSDGAWRPTHRHLKRGTLYELLGLGMLQIEPGAPPLQDYDRLAVYWDEKGGLWLRPADEFFDGRFEEVATPSLPDTSCKSEGE